MRRWWKAAPRAAAVAGLAACWALSAAPAMAHEGHAGPDVQFVSTKEALQAMLPEGARIARRKEPLAADGVAWAKAHLGVSLAEEVQTYYLARDPGDDRVIGTAMVREYHFEHGKTTLAVGLDADGRVTRAAVLSTQASYVSEFEDDIGTGFLDALHGLDVGGLADAARGADDRGEAAGFALEHLRDMAAALATLAAAVQ